MAEEALRNETKRAGVLVTVVQGRAGLGRLAARTTALALIRVDGIGVLRAGLVVDRPIRRRLLLHAGLDNEVGAHLERRVPVPLLTSAADLKLRIAVAAIAPELGDGALGCLARLGV